MTTSQSDRDFVDKYSGVFDYGLILPGVCNNAGIQRRIDSPSDIISNTRPCGYCGPCDIRRQDYLVDYTPRLIALARKGLK